MKCGELMVCFNQDCNERRFFKTIPNVLWHWRSSKKNLYLFQSQQTHMCKCPTVTEQIKKQANKQTNKQTKTIKYEPEVTP
jgi:hypothetical protein